MRKKISQREAVRNRRELKRLREFIRRISGTYQAQDWLIATLSCDAEWVRQKMRGASWGANGNVVFVASAEREQGRMTISAVRVPDAP